MIVGDVRADAVRKEERGGAELLANADGPVARSLDRSKEVLIQQAGHLRPPLFENTSTCISNPLPHSLSQIMVSKSARRCEFEDPESPGSARPLS